VFKLLLQNKKECRAVIGKALKNYILNKSDKDKCISENLSQLISQLFPHGFKWAGMYKSLSDEPLLSCELKGQLTFPKVINDQEMEFYCDQANAFKLGRYGIEEPESDNLLLKKDHDFFVVPGLSFNSQGYRLGRGKGYYDRYLNGFNNIKIGVGYSLDDSKVYWVPDNHDVAMDYVVTDKFILKVV